MGLCCRRVDGATPLYEYCVRVACVGGGAALYGLAGAVSSLVVTKLMSGEVNLNGNVVKYFTLGVVFGAKWGISKAEEIIRRGNQ